MTADTGKQEPDTGRDYRYKHFTTRLLFRDLRFRKDAARPGDLFLPFELVTTSGDRLTNRNVFGDKPVLLIFGSMTCPMTASAAPSVQELYDQNRNNLISVFLRSSNCAGE